MRMDLNNRDYSSLIYENIDILLDEHLERTDEEVADLFLDNWLQHMVEVEDIFGVKFEYLGEAITLKEKYWSGNFSRPDHTPELIKECGKLISFIMIKGQLVVKRASWLKRIEQLSLKDIRDDQRTKLQDIAVFMTAVYEFQRKMRS